MIIYIILALQLVLTNIDKVNVTRAAQSDYNVRFYHINLNVSDSSIYIEGFTRLIIEAEPGMQQINLDFSTRLSTDSVKINGQRAEYTHSLDKLVIERGENTGGLITAEVFYHGPGNTGINVSGIYNRSVSAWNKRVTWTLSEPYSAKNWFPCNQVLTDKADSVYVFLSTDKNLKAGSNGLLTNVVPLPDNRVRYEWKSRYPIAYYLISFAVSDYLDYSFYVRNTENTDSILVQNYIYNDSSYLNNNRTAINKTGDLLLLYSDLFGPYPFRNEKYGHCTAPFSGGMEHQTMTTLVSFSFLLVAHELAHQWFGDHVTCSSWQDIWINEGFASYAEYLANQYLVSQEVADDWMESTRDYVKSLPGGSIYVPSSFLTNEGRIFDSRLSYKKGAAVIHMLRHEIGNDSLFFGSLTSFLHKFGNGTASGEDFKMHLEEQTAMDFDQFFNQWYYGEGYPIHNINWEQKNDTLYISSLQTTSSGTAFFDVMLEFRLTGEDTDTIVSFRQASNYSTWKLYLPADIHTLQPDPNNWLIIDFATVARVKDSIDRNFRILPNPAKDKVTIKLRDPVGKFSLFVANTEGRILTKRTSSGQQEEIDVRQFPSGMYFVIIQYGQNTGYGKFIVN